MTFAGHPTATLLSGISVVTTAPAPMIQLFPICILGITIAPVPSSVDSPILTFPASLQPGPILE